MATAVDETALRDLVLDRLGNLRMVRDTRPSRTVEATPPAEAADNNGATRPKIIFDLEYITDDFFALAVAINAPELDVLGVTLVPHTESTNEARVVSAMLDSAGREDIPLAISEPGPFQQYKGGLLTLEGEDRLRGVRAHQLVSESAPDFIIRTVNEAPGQITLITVGPLENLGVALRRDPSIAHKIKRLIMMGGSIAKDYSFADQPERHEHNVSDDVPAAQTVLSSGIPILMVGLDATANLRFEYAELEGLDGNAPGSSHFLRERFKHLTGSFTPFDVMAVAMAIDRSFCEVRTGHVEVTDDGYTRLVPNLPENVEYCVNPNVEAFDEFMRTRLGVAASQARSR